MKIIKQIIQLSCKIVHVFFIIFPTGLEMRVMSESEDVRIISWDSGVRANTVSFPILHDHRTFSLV